MVASVFDLAGAEVEQSTGYPDGNPIRILYYCTFALIRTGSCSSRNPRYSPSMQDLNAAWSALYTRHGHGFLWAYHQRGAFTRWTAGNSERYKILEPASGCTAKDPGKFMTRGFRYYLYASCQHPGILPHSLFTIHSSIIIWNRSPDEKRDWNKEKYRFR